MVFIRVLGEFAAEVNGEPVHPGGPRQRGVLALLVAARGQVVPVDRMIEDLWRGEPPARALMSLQAYVSNLRRLLEPGRPPRAPARLLVSAPPGYALRLPPDSVDAWRFEDLLDQARTVTDPRAARARLAEALELWRGPAFAEVADEPWAAAETARLDELRLVAAELHVAAGLRTGDPATVVPEAERLTRGEPLREEGWRLHALALWSSGRQADALATLRRARRLFAEELGLDPGPDLTALEEAILTGRTDVLRATVPLPPQSPSPPEMSSSPQMLPPPQSPSSPPMLPPLLTARPLLTAPLPPTVTLPGTVPVAEASFVGREAELSALVTAAEQAAADGARVALVTGEAGLGKSTLLEHLGRRLERTGWLVAAGHCPEAAGAPPAWAWTEALGAVAAATSPGEHADDLAPLLTDTVPVDADATAGRFRLRRAVWRWLAAVAAKRPVAVVLDDLHWADAATLELLGGGLGTRAPHPGRRGLPGGGERPSHRHAGRPRPRRTPAARPARPGRRGRGPARTERVRGRRRDRRRHRRAHRWQPVLRARERAAAERRRRAGRPLGGPARRTGRAAAPPGTAARARRGRAAAGRGRGPGKLGGHAGRRRRQRRRQRAGRAGRGRDRRTAERARARTGPVRPRPRPRHPPGRRQPPAGGPHARPRRRRPGTHRRHHGARAPLRPCRIPQGRRLLRPGRRAGRGPLRPRRRGRSPRRRRRQLDQSGGTRGPARQAAPRADPGLRRGRRPDDPPAGRRVRGVPGTRRPDDRRLHRLDRADALAVPPVRHGGPARRGPAEPPARTHRPHCGGTRPPPRLLRRGTGLARTTPPSRRRPARRSAWPPGPACGRRRSGS
ncbi:BTAD domain-containing putative transcriptional regulator [Nonomuraea ferruginea]